MVRFERKQLMKAKALKPAIATLLMMAGQSMAAEPVPAAYNMAVIQDAAYGVTVMSGEYEEGITKIGSYGSKKARTFAANNNLCVAYTMSKKFESATEACEAALSIVMKYGSNKSPISTYSSRDQAVAYSNRGVLRAVTGDFEGAKQDFEYATRVSRTLEAAAENLVRLKSKEAESMSSSL